MDQAQARTERRARNEARERVFIALFWVAIWGTALASIVLACVLLTLAWPS
jgi:hypothetical protein